MHDPKHVVYEVRLPIPVRKKWRDAKHGEPRWTLGISRRTNAENVGERVYPWWNPKGYSPRVAGRAFESMRLVTIWHDEPGGADSGTVCSYAAAKHHPKHWTLQWHHWQKIRRTLFTRCEWCGGPSRTGDRVNISHQWYSPRPEHFWQSPRGVYHDDCSSIDRAHKTCLCGVGPWASGDYGKCEECGKFRAWKSKADAFHPGDEPLRLLASIPEGQRDRSKYAKASRMWRDYHEARRVAVPDCRRPGGPGMSAHWLIRYDPDRRAHRRRGAGPRRGGGRVPTPVRRV